MTKLGYGILSGGVLLLITICLVFFVGVPVIIDNMVEEEIQLKEGTEVYEAWANLTVPIYFTFRLFNITNPNAIKNGEKLIVEEVGPYVFLEKRDKIILNVNPDDDTITYNETLTYYFQPQMSNGSLNDELTLPNLPFISVATIARQLFPLGIPIVPVKLLEGVGETFVMTNVKVKDFIFDGIPVHDLYKLFMPLAPGGTPAEFVGNTFAFLNQKNGTSSGVWKIKTGIHDSDSFGQMVSWDGMKELPYWTNSSLSKGQSQYCNKLNGSDGTLYPPFVSKERTMYVFHTLLCRSLKLKYSHDMSYRGINGYEFTPSEDELASPDKVPDNQCFCPKPTGGINSQCFDGAYRIFGCHHGAPIVISLPHFLYGDTKMVDAVVGMKPDPELHRSYISIEKRTGTLLKASLKFQANLETQALTGIPSFENVANSLIPFIWLDLNAAIDDDLVETVEGMLLRPLQLVKIAQWTLIAISIVVIILGLVITARRRRAKEV